MAGPDLITLGCRLNIAESEAIRTLAKDQDDLVIINSCAVTAEAVRRTRQAIRRTHRARPDARIVVTGCAAELERDARTVRRNLVRLEGAGFVRRNPAEPATVYLYPAGDAAQRCDVILSATSATSGK